MRSLLMPAPSCVVTSAACMSKHSSLMSSQDLINIPAKQQPVIDRLSACMEQACAYADAIADNAIDDDTPIPPELVASFQRDYHRIITSLTIAANA